MLQFLVILTFLLSECPALEDLCNKTRSDNGCLCQYITDTDSKLPLMNVDCSAINLEEFPKKLQLKPDLNILDLSYNNIQRLDVNSISSKSLIKLSLVHNKIDYINDEFFNDLHDLRWIDLSFNNIKGFETADIFIKNKKLTRLNLSFNNIEQFPKNFLLGFQHLRYLDISYNPLGTFLEHTAETLSDFMGVEPNITHLEMNSVGLKGLDNKFFDKFPNLKYLALADNKLKQVPPLSENIEFLDLSGNELEVLTAHYFHLPNLKELKLNRMPTLTSIHKYALYNLPLIEKLYVTDCPKLREFNELIFGLNSKDTVVHPKFLSLARNGLSKLNETYKFLFTQMHHVDLSHNLWNCDCDLLWLKDFKHLLINIDETRCASPRRVRNVQVVEVEDKDLPECFPEKFGKRSHRILIPILIAAVVMLLALIGFLIKFAPLWYRPHTVGPQSPYSYVSDNN